MKMVSNFALAAALALGAASMGATPALAQKHKKDDAKEQVDPNAPSPTRIGAEYRKPAGAAEDAIKAKDWATADAKLKEAEALAQNDDERYFAARMRITVEVNKPTDLQALANAAQSLLDNPKTPAAEKAVYNYIRGDSTFKLKKHAEAIPYLEKARELGFTGAPVDLPLMLAQAKFEASNIKGGQTEIEQAIVAQRATGSPPPEDWYNFVYPRVFNSGDRAGAVDWSIRWLNDYPTAKNWRYLIVNYRNAVERSGDLTKASKLDLFRLMRATHALADQVDYTDYAAFAQQAGLPWEVISVIDEARSTGKVPASDPKFATAYTTAETQVKGEGSLDAQAKTAEAAANGKAAASTGDAYLASGDYAHAEAIYAVALQKGSVDTDEVNLHRGIALLKLGRNDEARTAFAAVKAAPLSEIARFWVTWMEKQPAAS